MRQTTVYRASDLAPDSRKGRRVTERSSGALVGVSLWEGGDAL
jgi:hypothetical protein